jgi:hypothetical protein
VESDISIWANGDFSIWRLQQLLPIECYGTSVAIYNRLEKQRPTFRTNSACDSATGLALAICFEFRSTAPTTHPIGFSGQ